MIFTKKTYLCLKTLQIIDYDVCHFGHIFNEISVYNKDVYEYLGRGIIYDLDTLDPILYDIMNDLKTCKLNHRETEKRIQKYIEERIKLNLNMIYHFWRYKNV